MSKLIQTMLAAAALATVPLVTQAADLGVRPQPAAPFSWTGWYIGVHAGFGWGDSDMQTISSGAGYFADASRAQIVNRGVREVDSDGFAAGAQFGYLLQFGQGPFGGNFVVGFEADFGYLGLKGSNTFGPINYTCCVGAFTLNGHVETDLLASLRFRYGVAYGNWLLYSTGGVAAIRTESRFNFSDTFVTGAAASGSDTEWVGGYVFGTGVETIVWANWTVRAEWLQYRFNNVTVVSNNLVFGGAPFPGEFFSHSVDLKANVVRAALNYKF